MTPAVDPREALGARLGHPFQDPLLLREALTHRSFAHENPGNLDNERLALLGDAALSLVVAERLLAIAPDEPVGVLTPRRAALVSGESLARPARGVGLGAHLLLPAPEAVLGVIFREGGLEACGRAVALLAVW